MKKPVALIIMDGFGLRSEKHGNAIYAAKKPNLDYLFSTYPNTILEASGEYVGLPDGQMGNSEVGHTNIGAGRIVYQDLTRITKAIEDGDFFTNEVLCKAMENAKDKSLHLMGLLSDGGVHSHVDHLKALVKMAKEKGVEKVFLEVRKSNIPAFSCYQKCGFVPIGIRKGYYGNGEDAIVMERKL